MELFGNWEANTMTGKGHQGAIVSLDGQKFNIRPVASNTAEAITKSIVTLMEALNDFVYTVTYDNTRGAHGMKHSQKNLRVILFCQDLPFLGVESERKHQRDPYDSVCS